MGPATPTPPESETRMTYAVSVRRLNLRSAPTTDGAKVGQLKRGDTVLALGAPVEGKNGPWIRLEINGKTAYASLGGGKYLSAVR